MEGGKKGNERWHKGHYTIFAKSKEDRSIIMFVRIEIRLKEGHEHKNL
jgi:mRNA-degrading endonuclease RelE of RelBE toxin-antitoxin system